LIAKVGGGIT